MASAVPQAPKLKTGLYSDEVGTWTDINRAFKFLLENHIRYSLTTPPLLKDIKEGTCVIDATLARLYFNVNNSLKYIQMT